MVGHRYEKSSQVLRYLYHQHMNAVQQETFYNSAYGGDQGIFAELLQKY